MVLTCLPVLFRARRQYDIIFVAGFRALGISAVLMSKILRKVCILKADSNGEMSGDFFTDGLKKLHLDRASPLVKGFLWMRNALLCKADGFVSLSSDITAELITHGVNPKAVYHIPNGIDTSRFHPVSAAEKSGLRDRLGLPQEKTIVVFTGRLVATKGLPLLLRVWQAIQRQYKEAILLLVGAGGTDIHNCEAELKTYVRSHGLQASVYFTGAVPNVHEYLQASDLFVFPSENEAFGISLIEAMACGLAVITSSVGGLKDIVRHGPQKLVVEAGDFQQLYDAINTALSDSARATALSSIGLRNVRKHYSRDAVTQKYTKLFTQYLAKTDDEAGRLNPV
jgi:glycosyltransferase involved in cell wall biosynthesis